MIYRRREGYQCGESSYYRWPRNTHGPGKLSKDCQTEYWQTSEVYLYCNNCLQLDFNPPRVGTNRHHPWDITLLGIVVVIMMPFITFYWNIYCVLLKLWQFLWLHCMISSNTMHSLMVCLHVCMCVFAHVYVCVCRAALAPQYPRELRGGPQQPSPSSHDKGAVVFTRTSS